ncbi:MAG: hypothetical protein A4E73_00079 [Syntrophaceae bacterium PtaU1.Bin231]|nr:MAG: hypothetical protein A4E73_00079 [Syntrophaceae bacterium PtaU1.Bin231]HOG16581.1 hypothetical protein [Syntrophales bacterium]
MKNDEDRTVAGKPKSYAVGTFRPGDAEGIVLLFRGVYGEQYPIRLFYDAEAVRRANAEGRYHSIVARDDDGAVIGVEHLYRSAPGPSLYEAGAGLVRRDWRNRGLNVAMLGFLYEEFVPQKREIEEVYGEAVCNHPFMQKVVERFRHVETGIEVALMPAEAYAKEGSAPGRVAVLAAFRCYQSKPHRIYLPAAYERELRTVYARLDDRRDLALSDLPPSPGSASQIATEVFDFARVARISVRDVGADFPDAFARVETDATARKAVVLQVMVRLADPSVGFAVDELRRRGYFFGGALPRWFDEDGFLMQRLLCPPDFESIVLHSEFAKGLLETIRRDWSRAVAEPAGR